MSLGCVYDNGLCNKLSVVTKLNRLNERDLALGASVAQNFIPGIDLNVMLFENYGYIINSTDVLKDILDAGFRRLYLDVYWDADYEKWHLCPQRPIYYKLSSRKTSLSNHSTSGASHSLSKATKMNSSNASLSEFEITSINTKLSTSASGHIKTGFVEKRKVAALSTAGKSRCDFQLDFAAFVDVLNQYITLSDTNIAANLILLHLRPKMWSSINTNISNPFYALKGQSSLNSTLASFLGQRILTPNLVRLAESSQKLSSTFGVSESVPVRERWPDLKSVLYTLTSRLVVCYNDSLSDSMPNLNNLSSIAFPVAPTISNPVNLSVEQLSRLNFTDTFVSDLTQWINARKAGVSPVISNGSIDIYSAELQAMLEDHDYWAWAPNEPSLYTTADREGMISDGYSKSVRLDACAVMTEHGMKVADCNSRFPALCRNKSSSFDWIYAENPHTYFASECPKGFEFAIPATPLEARVARQIMSTSLDVVAWVDFNSLYLPNCWVTGGTNAVCPYNVRQDGRNGIGYIAVAAAVSFVALCVIFFLEWDRGKSPLMRKNMKRDKPRTAEFEGVPS